MIWVPDDTSNPSRETEKSRCRKLLLAIQRKSDFAVTPSTLASQWPASQPSSCNCGKFEATGMADSRTLAINHLPSSWTCTTV